MNDSNEDVSSNRRYDLYHLRYDLKGKAVVSVASISPSEKNNVITWKRRIDINSLFAEESISSMESDSDMKKTTEVQ